MKTTTRAIERMPWRVSRIIAKISFLIFCGVFFLRVFLSLFDLFSTRRFLSGRMPRLFLFYESCRYLQNRNHQSCCHHNTNCYEWIFIIIINRVIIRAFPGTLRIRHAGLSSKQPVDCGITDSSKLFTQIIVFKTESCPI